MASTETTLAIPLEPIPVKIFSPRQSERNTGLVDLESRSLYCETFETNLRHDCVRDSFAQWLVGHGPNVAAFENQYKR